jgi:hypothetical protein
LQLVGVGFREGDDAVLFDVDLREGGGEKKVVE